MSKIATNKTTLALDSNQYVLIETDSMENVFLPIRNTVRVKYTCFDVSQRFVVFGSTSGGIYVFLRESLQYLKSVTNKDGLVSQVAIAPDDSILAFSTSRGHVVVLEHNADKDTVQPNRVQFTYDHKGAIVTSLHWSNTTARLYAGDDTGRVTMINVSLSRTRSLFQVPSATLMKVDSRVVQLDYSKDFLLVSSLTRSYIYNTNTEQWVQIGKKLRDGEFGACLYPGPRYQDPCTIYTARPGARLWEADLRGNVLSTHQFKQALLKSTVKIVSYQEGENGANHECDEQSSSKNGTSVMGFTKLYTLWPSHELSPFILTWSSNGFCILNPKKAEVLLRCDKFPDIKYIKCYKSYLYLNYQMDKFARISVLPLDKAAMKLFHSELYFQCADFIADNVHYFSSSLSKKSLLSPANFAILLENLKTSGHTHLITVLLPILKAIQAFEDEKNCGKETSGNPAKSVRRPRSALAISDPNSSRRASPQPLRCRSASPLLRQRHPSSSPTPRNTSHHSNSEKRSKEHGSDPILVKSQEEIRKPKFKPTHRKTKSDSNAIPSTSSCSNIGHTPKSTTEKPHDVSFKPLPLPLNGLLSPVDECRAECSPVTHIPIPILDNGRTSPSSSLTLSLYNPSIASDTPPILTVDRSSELDLMSSSQATLNGSSSEEFATNQTDGLSDGTSLSYDFPYRLLSLSVHGGGLVFPPGFDYSVLSSHDVGEMPPLDLGKLKDSISSTFTSGKKVLLQNWKDLENRFKQMGVNETAMVTKGFVHSNSLPSSTWDSPDDGTNKENQGDPNGTYLDNRYWSSKSLHDSSVWEDTPPVDIGALLSATAEARIRLRDPDILLDPIGRREVLESWVNVLNETQLETLHFVHNQTSPLQEPCDNGFDDITLEVNGNICQPAAGKKGHSYHPDFIPPSSRKIQLRDSSIVVYCPFKVTSEVHAQMSSLAVSCFRTKILGSSLSELSLFFPSSGSWENSPDLLNGARRSDSNGNSECSKESLDAKLALFVNNYFHLLCGNSERREKLVEEFVHLNYDSGFNKDGNSPLSFETRFKTWCAFNEGIQLLRKRDEFDRALQKSNLNACVDNLLESFRITRVTIARIAQLSRLDFKKTLEVCSKLCHQISPIDLLYISNSTGHHHPSLFVKCIDLIIKEMPAKQKTQVITNLFSSYEVQMNWIRFAINQPPETDGSLVNLRCSVCGNPVPGSHLYQWPMGKELLHVLDIFGSDESCQHLTQFCQEKGFWPGYLLLLKKRRELSKHLDTLLLLDDARLLSIDHPLGCFPENQIQWAAFLTKLATWHEKRKSAKGDPPWACGSCSAPTGPAACFSDKHSLTLDVAVRRMLSAFSPSEVLNQIRSLDIPNGTLTSSTFRATLVTHLIDTQQNILSHSILARMESYLWLRRSTSIPPQIWKVFEEESRLRGEAGQYKKSPKAEYKPEPSLKQRCLRYLEEPDNNWGVTTRIQRSCPLCGIQLCANVFECSQRLSKATGVTVGSCGHAFHSSCLGQQITPCPLCIDKKGHINLSKSF